MAWRLFLYLSRFAIPWAFISEFTVTDIVFESLDSSLISSFFNFRYSSLQSCFPTMLKLPIRGISASFVETIYTSSWSSSFRSFLNSISLASVKLFRGYFASVLRYWLSELSRPGKIPEVWVRPRTGDIILFSYLYSLSYSNSILSIIASVFVVVNFVSYSSIIILSFIF